MRNDRPDVCYAFDLTGDAAVVVRAVRRRRRIHNEVVWEGPLDDPGKGFAQAVAGALFEARAGRALTVAAMPAAQSIIRQLTAPFPSISKARKVLPALLDIQLPFPLETCVYQFCMPMRDNHQVKALAVVAQAAALQSRIDDCASAGVDPMRMDHEALAIWSQSIAETAPVPGERRVVLYLARDHHVMVIGRGASFESAHSGQAGLDKLASDGSAPSGDAKNSFTGRVQRVLRAHIPDLENTAVAWFWAGPGADRQALCKELENELPAAITYRAHTHGATFLANGLADRALHPEREPTCDLRTGAMTHPLSQRLAQKTARRMALGYLALGALIIAVNTGWLQFLGSRTRQAGNYVRELAQSVAPKANIQYGQELLVAQRAYEKDQESLQPFLRAFGVSASRQIKEILDTARRHGIQIEGLTLRDDYVSLQGASAQWTDCDAILEVLAQWGFSTQPPVRKDAGPDEKVHFSIEGTR
ncbi:MAG: hypothetical protein EOM20_00905 [Spartobacteria bacterium]|nr:hypothetical protein [Spartobacteria bacterium]